MFSFIHNLFLKIKVIIGLKKSGRTGIKIERSSNITIKNSRVEGFDQGIITKDTKNLKLDNTEIK